MFSSISHEFRTPLNAFMNALTLIKINFESVEAVLDAALGDKPAALKAVDKHRESLHRSITTASVSSKVRKSVA